ncbi:reticulon-3-like isoform X1 [Rhagoletis pomonella]|nr:reticulon-3-like isoform X1 [Rhagoletis pomonella]
MASGNKFYSRANSNGNVTKLPERGPVESLIYWRDVKKSGIFFGAGLVTLLAISCFSVISVFAYLSLLTLAGTVSFRIYKSVMQAIQKTPEGHPFK